MEQEAKQWPVDFETVEKGRYFCPEEVAEIFGTLPGTPKHQLACLGFKGTLETKLAQRLYYVTCVVYHDGVRVLTDWEATEYRTRNFLRGFRKMGSDLRALGKVDTAEFSAEQMATHEQRVRKCSTIYLAAKRGSRDAVLAGKSPETAPVLIEGP